MCMVLINLLFSALILNFSGLKSSKLTNFAGVAYNVLSNFNSFILSFILYVLQTKVYFCYMTIHYLLLVNEIQLSCLRVNLY